MPRELQTRDELKVYQQNIMGSKLPISNQLIGESDESKLLTGFRQMTQWISVKITSLK